MPVAILHAGNITGRLMLNQETEQLTQKGRRAYDRSHEASILVGGAQVWDCSGRIGSRELFNHREQDF